MRLKPTGGFELRKAYLEKNSFWRKENSWSAAFLTTKWANQHLYFVVLALFKQHYGAIVPTFSNASLAELWSSSYLFKTW